MPVTAFELALRRPLAGGQKFGDVGPYEELKGRLRFAIDPRHPANTRITDIALASTNAAGRVEFAADVSILVPLDRGRGNGRIVLDVVNRGNTVAVPNFNRASRPVFGPDSEPHPPVDVGDGFLMRRGYTVISCGWQGDVPQLPGLFRMDGPEALGANGRPLRGRVYVQLQASEDVPHFLLSDRGHLPYPAADLDEPDALMIARDQPDGEPEAVPRDRWRFARVANGKVVRASDYVHLDDGFRKGRLYQVIYSALGAPIRGIGIAALRDSVSWLKHGSARAGNPAAGASRWAFAYGRSQTARLLRTLVYDDLNLDEDGREALDGLLANVGGGMRGEFNQRFGQNSKDRPHLMPHLFPFTDVATTDPVTGITDALHRRIDARGGRLKTFYTNTSAEYHRGDASLIHTDPDGEHDLAHGPNVRVYHFTGTEHGLGIWPPTDTVLAAADPTGRIERSQNLRSTIDYAPLLRACLVNLDRWVTDGLEPPPSRHPRIDDGTAVRPEELRAVFDRLPDAHYLGHHARPRRQDFRTLPPEPGPAYGSRVSTVDADGNEVAGIVHPQIAVPLATHTGWTRRHPDIGGEDQLLVFGGATIPLPRTQREREASGDPRRSIAERYASRADYLEQARQAGRRLVTQRHLLEEDVEVCVELAARLWDWLAARSPGAPSGVGRPDL
jgi:hypothetical protein